MNKKILVLNRCQSIYKYRIERQKFYPGPGLEPWPFTLRANNALTN